jgi:hypothetical protein
MGFTGWKNQLPVAFVKEKGLYNFDKPKQSSNRRDKSRINHDKYKPIHLKMHQKMHQNKRLTKSLLKKN